MSFGDFLVELLNTARNKGIETAVKKAKKENLTKVTVQSEDYILTDEEFHEFMQKNESLIYKELLDD